MWYQRKDITPEEAEKERLRLIALEDREDDEFDEARIANMVGADELEALKGIDDYTKTAKDKKDED